MAKLVIISDTDRKTSISLNCHNDAEADNQIRNIIRRSSLEFVIDQEHWPQADLRVVCQDWLHVDAEAAMWQVLKRQGIE